MTPPAPRADTLDMHAADVATFAGQIDTLTKRVDKHDDRSDKTNDRLLRIELALATALGGLLVLGWLINRASDNILHLLAK